MNIDKLEGLTTHEVAHRQKRFGYNELPVKNKLNLFKMFIGLAKEPMIFLLLTTVVIYFICGDRNEALLLLGSFLGIIGIEFYQDIKTEKSLEALKNLSSPIADVIRSGKRMTIPGREVVVGDIIFLSEGSRVPADAKLISSSGLMVNESLLTGESVSVEKSVKGIVNYRTNSVFSGTLITKGHGIAEVTSIGLETEIGKIGVSLNNIKSEKTLLKRDVDKAIKVVATGAISLSVILFALSWALNGDFIRSILAGLTLSIAILPEEFPIVLTIFLALGSWRLAKNNVLSRRSHMIETLGSVTVLCVDKTGTLTENRMKIQRLSDKDGNVYSDDFSSAHEIIRYGVLSSQRHPFDPMEEAFLDQGRNVFKHLDNIYEDNNIIHEYQVEEESLSVVHVWGSGDDIDQVALKGAPEAVFELCHLEDDEKKKLFERIGEFAKLGLRVIAVAKGCGDISHIPKKRDGYSYEFLGLVGLADPIRKEAIAAAKDCRTAGIRMVMITGDHHDTAVSIAKQVGLNYENAITGSEFEALSETERRKVIKNVAVFSRVNPSHKLMIVNAFKDNHEVVAMTGDGVNDAPALKAAHVGIAMGKHGTDVARESAGIVLMDDNFSSIVAGIRLGRRIYDNLQKAMSYIIAVHIPIAVLSIIPVMLKWPLLLIPIHIVFMEFIIDPSCTIIFENEKEDDNIMKRLPRKLSESIFNRHMVVGSLLKGLVVAVVITAMYGLMLNAGWSESKAGGLTFISLVMSNLFLIFNLSGKRAVMYMYKKENLPMLFMTIVVAVSLIMMFTIAPIRELFHFSSLTLVEAMFGILIGFMSTIGVMPIENALAKRIK